MSVRMTILCEDQAKMGFSDKKFFGQHGLAIFIEAQVKILFDTGPSDVLLANARTAGIDLSHIDWIVLSHGHWDHADGLISLSEAGIRSRLLCHPNVFADRHKSTGEFNGMAMAKDQVIKKFDLVESINPFQIVENLWFLGEIPRNNDFEGKESKFHYFKDKKKIKDFLIDDTALALKTRDGLTVITGCSHAGICNICEYAKEVTGEKQLHMVIGGFHLLEESDGLEKTIQYFQKNKPEYLYPMHCTGLSALSKFHSTFGIEKLCTGDVVSMKMPLIIPGMTVLDIVAKWESTQEVFKRYDSLAGECICCNSLFESLEKTAEKYSLDLDTLLDDLETAAKS